MIKANIKIKLSDLKIVLEVTTEELKRNKNKLLTLMSVDEKESVEVR